MDYIKFRDAISFFFIGVFLILIGIAMKRFATQIPYLGAQPLPHLPSALLVTALIVIGNLFFALPGSTTNRRALARGALYGFIVYGVYNLTNLALLSNWPVQLSLIDIGWGTSANAVLTSAALSLAKLFNINPFQDRL